MLILKELRQLIADPADSEDYLCVVLPEAKLLVSEIDRLHTENEKLETALDEMTRRCQAAEYSKIKGHFLFSPRQLSDYLDKARAAWEASRSHGQKIKS